MPDWQELVRQRLSGLALDATVKEEVHAELAAHLEESYETLFREGMCEEEAIHRALSQVASWKDLERRICAAKKECPMQNRVRQLWVPGFVTLALSMSLLLLIQFHARNPQIVDRSDWYMVPPVLMIHLPWLPGLLLIGALGAYLSHRGGASRHVVFISILFPVLPYLTFLLIGFPLGLVLEKHVTHNIMFLSFFVGLLAWVLLPGVALLVGGLLVHLLFGRRSSSQDTAIS